MIRQLRIQYSDTWYHVMDRGENSGQQVLGGTDGKGGSDEGMKKMGAISVQKIAAHTPERRAEDFEQAISQILNMPPVKV